MNKINYMRISVTDRCNLNCIYCNPKKKDKFLFNDEILSIEEMTRIVRIFSLLGVDKIRITGGEPLVRKDIVRFIAMLRKLPLIKEISITTNGLLLSNMAEDLKNVALDRINISLDTLRPDRFEKITGTDGFNKVYKGIMCNMQSERW